MSADNTIAILMTKDNYKPITNDEGLSLGAEYLEEGTVAYRVAHVQALDNFDYYKNEKPYMLGMYLDENWGDKTVHYDADDAWAEARDLLNEMGYVEYGIQIVDASGFAFPGY